MDLGLFFQILVNGLMAGGMYALVASGFTLILGVIQVFNMAQGQFYMLGAYVTFGVASGLGLPYPVAFLASLSSMALLGFLFHFGVVQWTIPQGFFHMMLVTIAFSGIVGQLSLLTFAYDQGVVTPVIRGVLEMGSVVVSKSKLVVIGGAIFIMVILYFFMKTKMGTAMLAAAENREVAGLQGINAKRIFWVTMAVGCGLCGVAGSLIVPVVSATNMMGMNVFIRSMLVVIIGGTGSMSGALMAAFLVGIIESFAFHFVEQASLLVIFAFAAVLVFFRPGGLLGKPLPVPGQ